MKIQKVVIAPDSFKESLTAQQVSQAIQQGLSKVLDEKVVYEIVPMADGGEGTMQSLNDALGGTFKQVEVQNALGENIDARYSYVTSSHTAIIELAEASGLERISVSERQPLTASTYGTGQLIKHALDQGAQKIILGIGGSATNDGGTGMMRALGVRFLDQAGKELTFGGAALIHLATIDLTHLDPRIKEVELEVVCDVDNPLLGERGAIYTYAKQKGATHEDCFVLERAMTNYNDVLVQMFQEDFSNFPGAGAAGGTGIALVAFLQATLSSGIDVVLRETKLTEKMQGADLCITGEGKMDCQTIYGKTPMGVTKIANQYHVPVIAFCGMVGEGYEAVKDEGIKLVFSLMGDSDTKLLKNVELPKNTEDAIRHAGYYIEALASKINEILNQEER